MLRTVSSLGKFGSVTKDSVAVVKCSAGSLIAARSGGFVECVRVTEGCVLIKVADKHCAAATGS